MPKRDIFGLRRTHEVSLQFGRVDIITTQHIYTKEPDNRYPTALCGKQTVAPSST
jgi:hypothetical protein